MKNESEMARKLKTTLDTYETRWTSLKHSDRFTKGIPDFSISQDGRTVWVEQKFVDKVVDLYFPNKWAGASPVQLELVAKLNGFYHVYCPETHQALLVPGALARQRAREGCNLMLDNVVKPVPGTGIFEVLDLIQKRLSA